MQAQCQSPESNFGHIFRSFHRNHSQGKAESHGEKEENQSAYIRLVRNSPLKRMKRVGKYASVSSEKALFEFSERLKLIFL